VSLSPDQPVPGGDAEVMKYDARQEEYAVRRPGHRRRIHAILFVATVLSTIYAAWRFYDTLWGGVLYSASIMAILLTHEMGHYLAARLYRIGASLPYFLPLPIAFFGTLGAVIVMDRNAATRKQLFDIGVAGPLAGMVVAIPVSLIGLRLSTTHALDRITGDAIPLGSSLLFTWMIHLFAPAADSGEVLVYHPVAFAGWAGLFVTALNLLPIGQLDGGHVLYGLFGRSAARISRVVFIGFALLAILVSPAWIPLVLLLLFFGHRHPPAREEEIVLDGRRKMIGAAALLLFLLTFTPVPIYFTLP